MSEIDSKIIEKIKNFAVELEKENIRVQQLYLFGSFAKSENGQFSDIDLAVVSDDFSGIRFNDYDKFISSILKIDRSIEPIAFRMQDTYEDLFFINEIQKKGIRII